MAGLLRSVYGRPRRKTPIQLCLHLFSFCNPICLTISCHKLNQKGKKEKKCPYLGPQVNSMRIGWGHRVILMQSQVRTAAPPSPLHSHSKPYTKSLYCCPQARQIRGTSLQMILEANHFFPRPFLCRPALEEMFRVGQAYAQASQWSGRLGGGMPQTLGKFHRNMAHSSQLSTM